MGPLPASGGVATLSTKDKSDLKILYNGLQAIMKELHDLNKYQNLVSIRRNPIDRLRWGQEDLVGLRDKHYSDYLVQLEPHEVHSSPPYLCQY